MGGGVGGIFFVRLYFFCVCGCVNILGIRVPL